MLPHQRRRIIRATLQRRHHRVARRRIAEAHGDVARPALVADPADRAARHPRLELLPAQSEEVDRGGAVETVANGAEVTFRGRLREAVPRAGELAIVAAVNAIADERTQIFRDRAGELDRRSG